MASAGALVLTALAGTSYAATGDTGAHPETQAHAHHGDTQDVSDARIKITPGGVHGVGINDPVNVAVSNGKLTKVTMTDVATGTEVPGTLSADGTSWTPSGPLKQATRYQVAAEAEDAKGRSAIENAAISTVSPANDFLGHLARERLDRWCGHARDLHLRQGDRRQGRTEVEDPGQFQQRRAGRRPLAQQQPAGLPP